MAGSIAEFKKFLLRNDYPEIDPKAMKIDLIQAADRVLPMMSEKASIHALKILKKLDVNVILNGRVSDYDGEKLTLLKDEKQTVIHTSTVVWAAGVKGNVLNGVPEKALVPGGRIKVNTYSQVEGLDNVFAIGDVAAMITIENPRGHPMVAQAAIQQGHTLAKNILELVKSNTISTKFQYKNKGSMATIGKKDAVADIKNIFLDGKTGWLLWSFIHLISITGFKNRFKVGVSWIMKYFSYEKANQLIVRKYERK
jgi:NADH dehydrogenase